MQPSANHSPRIPKGGCAVFADRRPAPLLHVQPTPMRCDQRPTIQHPILANAAVRQTPTSKTDQQGSRRLECLLRTALCVAEALAHPHPLPPSMPSPTDDDESEAPFPTLDHASTFSSHLSPDDAFISPPRRGYGGESASESTRSRLRRLSSEPGGGRRRKRAWKKLMWVKQSCTSLERHRSVRPALYSCTCADHAPHQTLIITPTRRLSSRTCSEIPGSSRTTSGLWSPTRP